MTTNVELAPVNNQDIGLFANMKKAANDLVPFLESGGTTVDRMIRAFGLELRRNPKLKSCNELSLINAFKRCCELGLEPNCDRVHLISYGGECQAQIGVQGWRTLLWRNPAVASVYGYPVFEADEFDITLGDQIKIHHKPNLDDGGALKGAYAIVKLKNGELLYKHCNTSELDQSKKVSPGAKSPSSPWNQYPEQMAVVAALRKLARSCALSIFEATEEPMLSVSHISPTGTEGPQKAIMDEDGVMQEAEALLSSTTPQGA